MWKFILTAVFTILWAFKASSEGFYDAEEVYDGEGLYDLGKSNGCNKSFTKKNGGFELTLHNLTVPCYFNISWNSSIQLYFRKVFLHESDSLNLYKTLDDALNGTNPLLKKPMKSQNGTVTLITKESSLIVMLTGGQDPLFGRIFEGFYADDCTLPVEPDEEILFAPTYMDDVSNEIDCHYNFNEIKHLRVKQVFTFEDFNMPNSSVTIKDGTFSGEYKKETATDFFVEKYPMQITVRKAINSTDNFKLKVHQVDSACSFRKELEGDLQTFKSPPYELNNGSIINECRWLIQHKNSKNILGLKLNVADFHNVLDIVSVNDGASELSSPLLQITTSNKNITQNQIIRASGSSLWVAYKPISYKSTFSFNVTVHGQGGYFKDNGSIHIVPTVGDDTVFLLEVDNNKVVLLNVDQSSLSSPATVSVYDGFDTRNLLTSIHRQIKYPIISRTSHMMVTGTHFKTSSFSAKFNGVVPGCNHMSSLSTENYILSQNCNSSCVWVIPPQDTSNSVLLVFLQYISLKVGDNLKIHKLDDSLTLLAEIGPNVTHVPHFSIPADIGVLINVTQSKCEKKEDKVVLIGHSSYIPACNQDIITKPTESLQISSPLYPDTYPLFVNCVWNVTAPKESVVHMAFENLNLAENDCIKISHLTEKPLEFQGKTLPNDLFFPAGNMLIDFDSSGCNKSHPTKTLNSDEGFLLNITVADCGGILEGKKDGEFNSSITGNKTMCIWKVSVSFNDGKFYMISYDVKKGDSLENYELNVYDGSSVRDSKIVNNSISGILSRTNTLIFSYKRLDVSKPSSLLLFKYKAVECNQTCDDNNVCIHPDWICNDINECKDFTDEKHCKSVPVPPEVKFTGYSATAFWLCVLAMLIIGVIAGLTVPVCYQKYKDKQYRRFQELDA